MANAKLYKYEIVKGKNIEKGFVAKVEKNLCGQMF